MDKSRAVVTAELRDIGPPPGRETEYGVLQASFEAVACMAVEVCPQNMEGELGLVRLKEALFWFRRSLGREHLMDLAGLGVDSEGEVE